MNISEYQKWTERNWGRTALKTKKLTDLSIMALGIGGEAGEVQDMIKKHIRTGKPMDVDAFCLELGDLLHYVVRTAAHFGIPAEALMNRNISKIVNRNKKNKNWKQEKNT